MSAPDTTLFVDMKRNLNSKFFLETFIEEHNSSKCGLFELIWQKS